MRVVVMLLLLSVLCSGPAFGHGMSEADQVRAAEGGFVEFFPLGATHMLTGYDHLLFLFGVVFFLTKFKNVVKFVTAFTLGHCITLILATFLGIKADYFLVDAVIALTVCYKGFDNVDGFKRYFGVKSPNLLAAVFVFGLIHGFGLSTRLQQVTIGHGMTLLGKIISFNIGVEAGQIAALAIILVFLTTWRRTESFKRFSNASNVGLIIVGGLLFVMQLHGYQHGADPGGFGFNEDGHVHAHEIIAKTTTPAAQELPEGWHIDPGETEPHSHDEDAKLPEGWHIDPGETEPHPGIVDQIFETRKIIKSARTDAEILDLHHPVSEIYEDLMTLRGMVADRLTVDLVQYDAFLKDAAEAAKGIDEQAHEGNVEKTRELIARFDKGILGIEELVMSSIHSGTHTNVPDGYHVDPGDPTPHRDHDHGDDHDHDHDHDEDKELPEGYHIDPGDTAAHKDHD